MFTRGKINTHRVISKPVIEKQESKETIELSKKVENNEKVELIIEEKPKEEIIVNTADVPVQPKKQSSKKKKYKLEELMAEDEVKADT